MAASTASGLQMAAIQPCVSAPRRVVGGSSVSLSTDFKPTWWAKRTRNVSYSMPLHHSNSSSTLKSRKGVIKAIVDSAERPPVGLPIDLKGDLIHCAMLYHNSHVLMCFCYYLTGMCTEILRMCKLLATFCVLKRRKCLVIDFCVDFLVSQIAKKKY